MTLEESNDPYDDLNRLNRSLDQRSRVSMSY